MSSAALEAFLARLYTDAAARQRFTADPRGEAQRAGLTTAECQALATCDRPGLEMAATSFSAKRARRRRRRVSFLRRLLNRG